MRESRPPDYLLMLTTAALVSLGLLMVYSTTFDWGYSDFRDPLYWLKRQMLWVVVGVFVAVVLARTDYTLWRDWAVPLLGGTLVLLLLVLLVGRPQWGAQRSLLGGSVQPGELAKVATVIYAAAWASSKGERIRELSYGLIPFSVWMGLVAGLVALQPDLSAVAVLVFSGFLVFFLSGAHIGQLVVAGLMGAAVFWGLITAYPHAHERFAAFLAGLKDPSLLPYHPQQALYALASGGLFGIGLGEGRVKFYLPAAHTDAVFAVVGEELGLMGCLLVMGLFGVLAWRGFRIALRAKDSFGGLLAAGLTGLLVFQAVLNMGVIASLLPFTGTNLPFVSMGGSSLVTSLAAVGLLESVVRGRPPRRWKGEEVPPQRVQRAQSETSPRSLRSLR
ncbi:MAG: putative peptidoglycan glycosyltransferase FtsW [Anaerolineae bacterium]|nr:putative lipid II flippase FtsW [Anaerolineae bacterium]MCX8068846.1 putative lipid II flippase FtsW [Anaerolineae bacterium]MDW7990677.1 putative peptidoglycan glycosyltransferase FtsW [Anaerolineae bacterium]